MKKQDTDFQELVRLLVPINSLAPALQEQVIRDAEIITVRRREYVFQQGSRDNYTYYLLEGTLELATSDQVIKKLDGGTNQAFFPVAQLQPRQMSARATTNVSVLRVNRVLLDKLLSLGGEAAAKEESDGIEVEVIEGGHADWVGSLLQSELFSRVPASNVSKLLNTMESVQYKAGDIVVRQGDLGDYYYLIRDGRCEVLRKTASGQEVKLAELVTGESFGEEALVTDTPRNATVRMVTNGSLLRLTKNDFVELIKNPLVTSITFERGCELVRSGAVWLDVRFRDEHAESCIPGSTNLPLSGLRVQASKLDHTKHYIAYCDTGSRSSVAAFMLTERGFEASYLDGGFMRHMVQAPVAATTQTRAKAKSAETPPRPAAAAPVLKPTVDPVDADVRASVLKTELARAAHQLEEAKRLQVEAEAARKAAEQELQDRLQAERRKLQQAAEESRRAAEREIEERLRKERERLEAEAEAARKTAEKELEERLRKERERLEAESRKANDYLTEARRLKEQIEKEKRAAEQEAERSRREQEEQLQRLKAEADARLQTEKQRLEQLYRQNAEELARIQSMKQEAEKVLMTDRRALEGESQRKLAELQAQLEKQYENERAYRAETEARLQEEKRKLETEARKQLAEAQAKLARQHEMERRQHEEAEARIARERQRLEDEARTQIEAAQAELLKQQEEERRARESAEAHLAEERKKIELEFLRNTAMLEMVQQEKAAAEAARKAASLEAEEIIREYQSAQDQARIIEQARLQEELNKLEQERTGLRREMDEARRSREEAERLQREAQLHLRELQERQHALEAASVAAEQIRVDIQTVKAEAEAAAERLRMAVHAEEKLEQARAVNARLMEETVDKKGQLRVQLENELKEWIAEQEQQQQASSKRRSKQTQNDRIKRKAREARVRTQLHDLYLIEELATAIKTDKDGNPQKGK